MIRRSPLARGARLRPRRETPRRSERVLDPAYLARVRGRPCLLASTGGCWGRVEAHHAGDHPLGRKADDRTAVSLCAGHHNDYHRGTRFFRGWTKAQRQAWAARAIAETQALAGRDTTDIPW